MQCVAGRHLASCRQRLPDRNTNMNTNMKKKMNKSVAPWCAPVITMSVCVLALLQLGARGASAQSSGSGGGSFSAAYLIPTVACAASSSDGTLDQCLSTGGGPMVLFGNIKTPSASSKNVL